MKKHTVKKYIPHWDLCEKYKLIDFKNGTKVTGSGFPIYKGKGSKLQRSLISYFFRQEHKKWLRRIFTTFFSKRGFRFWDRSTS